jgi:hypothetical protein
MGSGQASSFWFKILFNLRINLIFEEITGSPADWQSGEHFIS